MRVSVVIPARDEEAYVATALASVAGQTFPLRDLEAIVVVNGTADRTALVVREMAARFLELQVRLIEDPRPGVSRAKNLGARAAEGGLLVFLDADSRMAPNLVERIAAAAEDGSPAGTVPIVADSADLLDRGFFAVIEYGKRLFAIQANMLYCRRDLFEAAGGFDERLCHAEDRDLLVRLQRRGVHLGHVTGTWIATSARRLHQGPLRTGMLRMFARWSLGHAGIWRDRPY